MTKQYDRLWTEILRAEAGEQLTARAMFYCLISGGFDKSEQTHAKACELKARMLHVDTRGSMH